MSQFWNKRSHRSQFFHTPTSQFPKLLLLLCDRFVSSHLRYACCDIVYRASASSRDRWKPQISSWASHSCLNSYSWVSSMSARSFFLNWVETRRMKKLNSMCSNWQIIVLRYHLGDPCWLKMQKSGPTCVNDLDSSTQFSIPSFRGKIERHFGQNRGRRRIQLEPLQTLVDSV